MVTWGISVDTREKIIFITIHKDVHPCAGLRKVLGDGDMNSCFRVRTELVQCLGAMSCVFLFGPCGWIQGGRLVVRVLLHFVSTSEEWKHIFKHYLYLNYGATLWLGHGTWWFVPFVWSLAGVLRTCPDLMSMQLSLSHQSLVLLFFLLKGHLLLFQILYSAPYKSCFLFDKYNLQYVRISFYNQYTHLVLKS